VPILLFLKPFYLRWEHNRARAKGYRGIGETSRVSALDGDEENEGLVNGHGNSFDDDGEGVAMISQNIDDEHEEFEFSEAMIHQVIHTIGKSNAALGSLHMLTVPRILPQLCLAHCFLPSSLGLVPCSSAAQRRPLEHDSWACSGQAWRRGRHHDRRVLLPLVLPE